MKHVWRIENADGEGPYANDDETVPLAFRTISKHPAPYMDPGLSDWWGTSIFDEKPEYVFGFKSLSQYRKWFNDITFRRELEREGFQLNRYEVPDDWFKASNHQAVFVKDKAKLIETRSPGEA